MWKKGHQKKIVEALKRKSMMTSSLNGFAGKSANEIAESIKIADSFSVNPEWKRLRKIDLETYGAKCMCCGFIPKTRLGINVDHIKPRKFFPELALSFDNLQILCARCNKDKGNKHSTDYRIAA